MALKIRLRQQGRNNHTVYRLVVADARVPRDGKYVESIGWYNPYAAEVALTCSFKQDRIQHWLSNGAQMTEKAKALIDQAAPHIVRQQTEKTVANRAKEAVKRRARKQAKTEA